MSTDQDYVAPSIISMEVDDDDADESYYRVRIGNCVKYLEIAPATLERDALSFPLTFLPPLPFDGDWSVAHISRDGTSGELKTSLSHRQLAAVQNVWHSAHINVLDLKRTEQLSGAVFEALLPDAAFPGTAPHQPSDRITDIAKIARFGWEIPYIEREMRAYQVLVQKQASRLAPRFLGHIHEEGRVKKLEGRRSASVDDLPDCERALGEFHELGLLHGDVNRYNFLVGGDGVKLIDLERFQEDASVDSRTKEIQSLRAQLVDESGKGGGFIFRDSEE